jgi:acetylornithine deacetylase
MGKMQAGDWVSTVAGWATLECRLGFVPGESGREVMAEVEQIIAEAVKNDDWFTKHPPKIEWFGWDTEPWLEPEDSAFLKAFLATSQKTMNTTPLLTGSPGGLDNRFGPYFNTPSVSFGPGGANNHGIDEYIDISSLQTVTKTLALFIAEWCQLDE